jgi:hypothetical protein
VQPSDSSHLRGWKSNFCAIFHIPAFAGPIGRYRFLFSFSSQEKSMDLVFYKKVGRKTVLPTLRLWHTPKNSGVPHAGNISNGF